MKKILAILGAGELGKQIAHIALSDNHFVKVIFFDDVVTETIVNGIEVKGTSNDIYNCYQNKLFDELLIGIGYKNLQAREFFFQKFNKLVPFATIVHSSCFVDITSVIDSGTVIYPGCCIDKNVHVGYNTILNLACVIAHDTKIGNHNFLAPQVTIGGFAIVGNLCFLAINTTVIDNVSVHNQIQIGAAALVIKDCAEPGLYFGVPAKFVKSL